VAKFSTTLTLRRNGQITLPSEVRRRMHASQAYFWTDEWQRSEREAQEDIRRGRVKRFRSAKALISDLKR
jgi:hypothetical protein